MKYEEEQITWNKFWEEYHIELANEYGKTLQKYKDERPTIEYIQASRYFKYHSRLANIHYRALREFEDINK